MAAVLSSSSAPRHKVNRLVAEIYSHYLEQNRAEEQSSLYLRNFTNRIFPDYFLLTNLRSSLGMKATDERGQFTQADDAAVSKSYGVPPSLLETALKPLEQIATVKYYSREQEISGYSERNNFFYRVRSGVVRKFALQPGGRRHILDLLLPGDFFGFGGRAGYFAEAAADRTIVAHYAKPRVEALARVDGDLAQALQTIASEAIARLERQMLILGKTTALEKVSCFLLEFATRINGETSGVIALPISRYDIGDYIAIYSETVCRSMTELKQRGAIVLQGPREVRIVDRCAL